MDFFKGCRSNVLLIDGFAKSQYQAFAWKGEARQLNGILANLRDSGFLCATTASRNELWLFGLSDLDADIKDVLRNIPEEDAKLLEEKEKGTLDTESVTTRAVPLLLDAIEGAISYKLATQSEATHLGPWTWLFPGGPDETGIVLRLHIGTTPDSALYAATTTEPSELYTPNGFQDAAGCQLFLAPGGQTATLALKDNSQNSMVDSAQMSRSDRIITGSGWKDIVTDFLAAEGIEIDSDEQWILVRLNGGLVADSVLWPSRLVFGYKSDSKARAEPKPLEADWSRWFAATNVDGAFRDTRAAAEEWFNGAPAREKAAVKAFKTKEPEPTSMETGNTYTSADMESVLATSPSFAQRNADQQVAISGIYPTPPDVLVPGLGSQQHPHIDSVLNGSNAESTALGAEQLAPIDENQLEDQGSSPDALQAFQSNGDDLFGEMDEMDFAGDEVGDADFSFFDEPDDEPPSNAREDTEMIQVDPTEDEHRVPAHPQIALIHDNDVAGEDAKPSPKPDVDSPSDTKGGALEDSEVQDDKMLVEESGGDASTILEEVTVTEEKPLSPFGIKERLLPPPIPASATHSTPETTKSKRRSSTFDPVVFREGLDLGQKYTANLGAGRPSENETPGKLSISLPPKRKKPRVRRPSDIDSEASDQDNESEEDSYESASSVSDDDLPPKLPWDTKKRKRFSDQDTNPPLAGSFERLWPDDDGDSQMQSKFDELELEDILDGMMRRGRHESGEALCPQAVSNIANYARSNTENGLPPLERLFDNPNMINNRIEKLDLVYVAQIASEQSISCIPLIQEQLAASPLGHSSELSVAALTGHNPVEELMQSILPGANSCAISDLALIREPPQRQVPAPGRPGQPRPPQRGDTMNLGPDFHGIPPPFVRVQRGSDKFDMLPPALDFWESLSLSPSNGTKDVRAFCVFPSNEDVRGLVDAFMGDLSAAYEGCKLGSHVHVRNMSETIEEDVFEDGFLPVHLTLEEKPIKAAMRKYASECYDLGFFLSRIIHLETERTIVVYMVNPFSHPGAAQHLSTCFWLIYTALREELANETGKNPGSDVVLQLIPIDILARSGEPVILDARQLGMLAKETYDRCPPRPINSMEGLTAVPGYTTPFVELASVPPKRINFQLAIDPPSDLLHEPSILHVAYALTDDNEWMVVTWIDSIGRDQSSVSLSMRGKTFAEVAEEVWSRTREIMGARDVTWRVFIISPGAMDTSIQQCWRKLIAQPRKHLFHATFVSVDLDPTLKLLPPAAIADDAGVLTPASTPQSTPFTFSPDASSHNAPATPGAPDTPAAIVENDPEAHLIDMADESWAVLLSPTFAKTRTHNALANGALFKRGDEASSPSTRTLPAMSLSLVWTLQIRPNAHVDEGNVKQAEATLREVLRMYRHLSVLTRARGLTGNERGVKKRDWGVMPVHLVAAIRGAEALNGFLD